MKKYKDICRNEIFNNKDRFLMSQILVGSEEEKKILNVNCDGYGRIRIFKKNKFNDWNYDPIPMAPMAKKMNIEEMHELPVQMFEVAKCNLNCWWCYLPDELKAINTKYMKWFSVQELLNLFLNENNNVKVIYLSGGNPELVPELIYQFMKELERRKLDKEFFLWSDDVLTTDFLTEKIDKNKLIYMINYNNYAKVCCLKGFDGESFEYNTGLKADNFELQLGRLEKYIKLGFDVYSYIILTCKDCSNVDDKISNLIDRLQEISYYLPLRIIPIKIEKFAAVVQRLNKNRNEAIEENQYYVLDIWNNEIKRRYTEKVININIAELKL